MSGRKRLKKLLGEKYIFKKYLSSAEVRKLLCENPRDNHEKLFASLTVGCVKINAVIYPTPDCMTMGYDILVKDTPESAEWICYNTLNHEVKYNALNLDQEMFNVLIREVEKYGLSYTDCNFEIVNGKVMNKE